MLRYDVPVGVRAAGNLRSHGRPSRWLAFQSQHQASLEVAKIDCAALCPVEPGTEVDRAAAPCQKRRHYPVIAMPSLVFSPSTRFGKTSLFITLEAAHACTRLVPMAMRTQHQQPLLRGIPSGELSTHFTRLTILACFLVQVDILRQVENNGKGLMPLAITNF